MVATCEAGEFTLVVGYPDPAHPAGHAGPGDRDPGAEHPGDRPGCRRRLRLQAAGHRGRGALAAGQPQAGPAGQVDRVPQRGQHDRAPRPGPVAADPDRRRLRRAAARPVRGPARRHGRLPDAGHARRAAARRVHVPGHLQDGRVLVPVHRRVHHQDAHRRLPRRRAARGHLRDRADHGRARRRTGRGPAGDTGAELDQARGVPVHDDRHPAVRLGQLRGRHGAGQGTIRLRRAAAGADRAEPGRRPGPARHRGLHLYRDVRAGPVPGARLAGLRRGRLGASIDPDAAHREGRGGHRVQRARPRS